MTLRPARGLTVEGIFWFLVALVVLPQLALRYYESQLRAHVQGTGWTNGWVLLGPDGKQLGPPLTLPQDLRTDPTAKMLRHWVYRKAVSFADFADWRRPALVLGRIGDSDATMLAGCPIGATGLSPNSTPSGYWWSVLRFYEVPDRCVQILALGSAALQVDVYKQWGSGFGIYAGPIGIGEYDVLQPIVARISMLRSGAPLVLGALIFLLGLYYLLVFVLVPARRHNGIFALCAIAVGIFVTLTSTIPFQLVRDPSWLLRLLVLSAITTATMVLWFLRIVLHTVPRWILACLTIAGAIAVLVGLGSMSLATLYAAYLGWQPVFLICFFLSYLHFIWASWQGSAGSLWRYGLGFSGLVIACLHDVYWTRVGGGQAYLIPYGFVLFTGAAAVALAEEYAAAFLHVESQVTARTHDLSVVIDQLRSLEQMKARFFANVSHDFKSPLTIALGAVQDAKTHVSEGMTDLLNSADRNLRKLLEMISVMLDGLRAESGNLKPVWQRLKLVPFVERCVQPYRDPCSRRGIGLHLYVKGLEGLEIPLDAGKMERVLDNLLSNALKFTDRRQDRERQNTSPPVIVVSITTELAHARVVVEDSGIGVPPDEREKIFERYYQSARTSLREHGGSGIGLSFAKEMVDLHNGRIWVEESEWGGSKFVVELPLSQDVEITGEDDLKTLAPTAVLNGSLDVPYPPAEPTPGDRRKSDILVVEDNPEVAQIILRALAEEYNVHFASGARQAVERIERRAFDCVVADIRMPRMTGTELLQWIRRKDRLREMPVVMLTSMGETEDVVRHLNLGADDYIEKPFEREVLRARVRTHVETHRLRKQLVVRDKLASLGTLTTGLCHEIRNPLNNIGAAVIRLRQKPGESVEDEIFDRIENNVLRADRIIQDLLKSTQRDSLDMETRPLRELTDEAIGFFGGDQHPGIRFESRIPADISVRCHPHQLKQVFLTVILNAVQAIRERGTIELTAEVLLGRVRIYIADDGAGISDEARHLAFDPFFTTKQNGSVTGLGLTIAQSVMVRLGGSIDIRARDGGGSVVTLELEGCQGEEKNR